MSNIKPASGPSPSGVRLTDEGSPTTTDSPEIRAQAARFSKLLNDDPSARSSADGKMDTSHQTPGETGSKEDADDGTRQGEASELSHLGPPERHAPLKAHTRREREHDSDTDDENSGCRLADERGSQDIASAHHNAPTNGSSKQTIKHGSERLAEEAFHGLPPAAEDVKAVSGNPPAPAGGDSKRTETGSSHPGHRSITAADVRIGHELMDTAARLHEALGAGSEGTRHSSQLVIPNNRPGTGPRANSASIRTVEMQHSAQPSTMSQPETLARSAIGELQARDLARDDNRAKGPAKERATSGDRILDGLFGGQPALPTRLEPASTAADSDMLTTEGISELASEVAKRILVSDPAAGNSSQVRIELKGSVLGGTAISITQRHGELQVALSVPDQVTAQQLKSQAGQLQAALATKVSAPVQVTVNVQTTGQDQGGMAQGGQSSGQGQDGRSRNQRSVAEEWHPDDDGLAR